MNQGIAVENGKLQYSPFEFHYFSTKPKLEKKCETLYKYGKFKANLLNSILTIHVN